MSSWDRSTNFIVWLSINYVVIYHSYPKKQGEDVSVNQTKQLSEKKFIWKSKGWHGTHKKQNARFLSVN